MMSNNMNHEAMAQEIYQHVVTSTTGWCGAHGSSLGHVAKMVLDYGGDEDHLEIGSLFGASARAAWLAKTKASRLGKVICIDPMEYERHEPCLLQEEDPSKHLMLRNQHQIFVDNTKKFVNIELVQQASQPWPLPMDRRFSTAFIDGWHYGDGPLNDAKVCTQIVDRAIILDDILLEYPAVYEAFQYLCGAKGWYLSSKLDRVALFIKYEPVRFFTETGEVRT